MLKGLSHFAWIDGVKNKIENKTHKGDRLGGHSVGTNYVKEKLNIDVDLQLKKKKGKAYYDQNLKELLYPKVSVPYPISTIHKVKGMTFSSVLLVLSNNSAGEKISLTDFVRPAEMPSEKQRMIYVAMSRPEVLSCIAIPNSFSQQQIREALGDNIDFEGERELNLF